MGERGYAGQIPTPPPKRRRLRYRGDAGRATRRLEGDAYERVEFEDTDWEVILIDGEPQVAYFDEEPFLTVRGRTPTNQTIAS